jgi:uncharacterized protein YlxW (UPF0749 family)
MKKNGSQYILLIVFLIFGIVVAVQIKSGLYARKTSASNALTSEALKQELVKEQEIADDLKAAIDQNLAIRNDFIDKYIIQENDVKLAEDWERIKLSTGLSDVKGPGITIKLDDAPARQPDTPVNWLIIHDQDIKVILNELKIAGAQAISINGERVVPMSEQLCAGPTIMINGNRYSVPYYIEVIGDPDELYDSINNSSRIALMREFNIRIDINKSKELKIAKFRGSAELDRYISGLEEVEK